MVWMSVLESSQVKAWFPVLSYWEVMNALKNMDGNDEGTSCNLSTRVALATQGDCMLKISKELPSRAIMEGPWVTPVGSTCTSTSFCHISSFPEMQANRATRL